MSADKKKGWLIAPGPASKDLAVGVAERLGSDLIEIDTKLFPDGESYFRIMSDVMDRRIAIVQSTYPPIDRHILQLLFLAHKLNEDGAEVHVIVPYLAYARQHRVFLQGEIVSLGVFARLLRSVGVRRIVTVGIHNVEGLGLFSIPAYSVSAIPKMAEYFDKIYSLKEAIAVSPDLGGSVRVEGFARVLGVDYFTLSKVRDRVTGEVVLKEMEKDVQGKDVILVDDIISSGKTIELAALKLKDSGARRVFATCVHPLLTGDALDRIKKAGVEELVGTNTIPSPISKIDVAPLLASYLSTL
ncbi:MAG: ribose-phosphate pyrophosphokinase [Candidatus Methylarchaceae archaeon HK01B]|nr:ribose-phosphate pyrophosphokinase [Candidatus Methylarchaceae archaeon HK01M]MCP8311796.1 ribose-phosphate pyrophosphokinase [Candidatus Methylarchaceae archaeon HK02M1]MCP8319277.1 ribose-phosphate pyrophosphokinase [Candidatus Methylarchaceae archaeon HK01B]